MSEFRLPITPAGRLAQAGAAEDRYRLQDEIARGGMGAVFRARDEVLGREVAVKVLLAPPANRPDLVRRFVQEARITGRLQHPGIPPVYELGWLTDGRPFLALKLIEGRTLAALLAPGRDPSADRELLLAAFERVCQTVAFAHSARIVHRDLKPSNVMVGAFGEVQVVDWGLARSLDDAEADDGPGEWPSWDRSPPVVTDAWHLMGTPAYIAPERVGGGRGDERSDVFGLGAILCEVLTGSPPYESAGGRGLSRMMVGNPAAGLERLRRCDADPRLIGLACACLSPDPADRPADAAELAGALAAHRQWVAERVRQADRDEAAEQARAAERAKRLRLTAGGLMLAAVLAAAVFGGGWLSQREESRRAEARQRAERDALAKAAEVLRREDWQQAVEILEPAAAQAGCGGEAARLLADARLGLDLERVP
ncbi:MAG: serine/threonine-protein kinase, partial [Gemmataceae bacterium]